MMSLMDAKRISWNSNQEGLRNPFSKARIMEYMREKKGASNSRWGSENLGSSASNRMCTQRESNDRLKEKPRVTSTNFH